MKRFLRDFKIWLRQSLCSHAEYPWGNNAYHCGKCGKTWYNEHKD